MGKVINLKFLSGFVFSSGLKLLKLLSGLREKLSKRRVVDEGFWNLF